jgi:hypothetical protein
MKALQLGEMKRKEIYTISVLLSYKVYHSQNGHFHPWKRKKQEMYTHKTILAVHSHLFTSKCRTFHKCAGHKKSDLFFIPINVARFTRVTFEKQAGLHVKCPLVLFIFDTL